MMSINEIMTPLMDSARTSYHTDGKLKVADLTELIKERPGIATPLLVYQPNNWTKASGWSGGFEFYIPVFENVPICVTYEVRNISATAKGQGISAMGTFCNKDYKELQYWDPDKDGNYIERDAGGFSLGGDPFSNTEGLRSGTYEFAKGNKRNVSTLGIGIGANVACSFEYRNLVISYYAPIKLGGVASLPLFVFRGCAA